MCIRDRSSSSSLIVGNSSFFELFAIVNYLSRYVGLANHKAIMMCANKKRAHPFLRATACYRLFKGNSMAYEDVNNT